MNLGGGGGARGVGSNRVEIPYTGRFTQKEDKGVFRNQPNKESFWGEGKNRPGGGFGSKAGRRRTTGPDLFQTTPQKTRTA